MRRIRWRKARRIAPEDKPRSAGGPSQAPSRRRSAGAARESGLADRRGRDGGLRRVEHGGEASGDLASGIAPSRPGRGAAAACARAKPGRRSRRAPPRPWPAARGACPASRQHVADHAALLEQGEQRARRPQVLQRLRRHDRLELLDAAAGPRRACSRSPRAAGTGGTRCTDHARRVAPGQVGHRPRVHDTDLPEVEVGPPSSAALPRGVLQRLPERPRRPPELAGVDDRERRELGPAPRRGSRPRRSRSG